ncbi:MAG: hypothetical protein IPM39_18465 [Chloroflexi bacterium]|nr:hypothetical protein [Chloroflexota bacterium]
MRKQLLLQLAKVATLLTMLALLLVPNWPAFGQEAYQLQAIVGPNQFDFVVWELRAAWAKGTAILSNGHAFLDETARRQAVLDYLNMVQTSSRLNWEIEQAYVNPDVADPDAATQTQQAELAASRAAMARLQPLAEAVLQDQVAQILREQGLQIAGRTWPPVMMHMTPLPTILIVSPRDKIERQYQISLAVGLTTPQKEAMETAVADTLSLSALVVPIGGLAVYPAMIMETSNINWLADVTAHEWTHHWLMPYPVSLNYVSDPQVRTINETVASIVGREIGEQVIARFYPEFVPPPAAPTALAPLDPDAPPPFNFAAEMAATRIQADAMLAAGDVDGAEAYMEPPPQLFVANGYTIRKLNQAYFAFYGAYADEPGAAGADPIGPTVLALREASPSLKDFLQRVARIGSFADLQQVAAEAGLEATAVTP